MRILILDVNHPYLEEKLTSLGYTCHLDYTSSKESLESKIHLYQGIIIRSRFKICSNFLDKCTSLKFIVRSGSGLENIDVDYAKKKNIVCMNSPEGSTDAVAEHSIGMLLSLFNNLNRSDNEVRSGKWNREKNRGVEIAGKTIGIIGYGNMGRTFAKKLCGFGSKVLAYDIKRDYADKFAQEVSIDHLFEQADILSFHVPIDDSTKNMFNEDFVNKFHKPFYLINTSRGGVVSLSDLVSAIKSKKVLGACLDVLEYEQSSFEMFYDRDVLNDHFKYLINSDKVIFSPHVAGWTVESHIKTARVIVEKIISLNENTRD
ncbi:2-hydroxyacid dehydrogenase [Ichthyobacterium seriolicida]|uniref:D-3-phosphoglycerate dehydrogenase n=1 Tax=Ichthyobacterium seriolicida TaxID=242600 RepID=A0A1J1E990_9FLAO|nr:2-hydroxyacid dehydrogenase [Ichthyobacterium seriolicida]BAV94096.1 D-3-phosphoglycerate dehydrogenase [Ichthyobacterium seriolicida]